MKDTRSTALTYEGNFISLPEHPYWKESGQNLSVQVGPSIGTEVVTNHFVQPDYLQVVTGYLFPVISIIYLQAERLEAHYSLISNQYTPYSYSRK